MGTWKWSENLSNAKTEAWIITEIAGTIKRVMKKEKDIDLQKCIESKQEQIIRVGKYYKDTHTKERKKEKQTNK